MKDNQTPKAIQNARDARAEYDATEKRCRAVLDAIRLRLDAETVGAKNWAEVGSLGHVEELLGEVAAFLDCPGYRDR